MILSWQRESPLHGWQGVSLGAVFPRCELGFPGVYLEIVESIAVADFLFKAVEEVLELLVVDGCW